MIEKVINYDFITGLIGIFDIPRLINKMITICNPFTLIYGAAFWGAYCLGVYGVF